MTQNLPEGFLRHASPDKRAVKDAWRELARLYERSDEPVRLDLRDLISSKQLAAEFVTILALFHEPSLQGDCQTMTPEDLLVTFGNEVGDAEVLSVSLFVRQYISPNDHAAARCMTFLSANIPLALGVGKRILEQEFANTCIPLLEKLNAPPPGLTAQDVAVANQTPVTLEEFKQDPLGVTRALAEGSNISLREDLEAVGILLAESNRFRVMATLLWDEFAEHSQTYLGSLNGRPSNQALRLELPSEVFIFLTAYPPIPREVPRELREFQLVPISAFAKFFDTAMKDAEEGTPLVVTRDDAPVMIVRATSDGVAGTEVTKSYVVRRRKDTLARVEAGELLQPLGHNVSLHAVVPEQVEQLKAFEEELTAWRPELRLSYPTETEEAARRRRASGREKMRRQRDKSRTPEERKRLLKLRAERNSQM